MVEQNQCTASTLANPNLIPLSSPLSPLPDDDQSSARGCGGAQRPLWRRKTVTPASPFRRNRVLPRLARGSVERCSSVPYGGRSHARTCASPRQRRRGPSDPARQRRSRRQRAHAEGRRASAGRRSGLQVQDLRYLGS